MYVLITADPFALYFSIVFVVLFLIALPLYLHAEKRAAEDPDWFMKATILKVILSGMCALCAFAGFMIWEVRADYSRILIVLALVSAVFGDYYLQYIGKDANRSFVGISFFMLTQVFLIVFLCMRHGISWPEFVITAVICGGMQLIMFKQKWKLDSTQIPLSIYMVLLVFMASKALLALVGGDGITVSMILVAAGAVLFVLSDLMLAIKNFATSKKAITKWHLIAYFCALLPIALASFY